jgi:hypothetical protein
VIPSEPKKTIKIWFVEISDPTIFSSETKKGYDVWSINFRYG